MEQKQIIHIATEVVVISGLAIYFKLKTNSLSSQVDELKKRLITQEQLIEEFRNRLDEQSLLLSNQDKLLTSLMIKQSLQPQVQAQVHSKSRSVPKQKVGIVWDSETDFQTENSPRNAKAQSHRLRETRPHIKKQTVKQREHPIERQSERQPVRHLEQPIKSPSVQSEREGDENLDEELANELFELQTIENEKHSDSESEIIEIDTSLKKKA